MALGAISTIFKVAHAGEQVNFRDSVIDYFKGVVQFLSVYTKIVAKHLGFILK